MEEFVIRELNHNVPIRLFRSSMMLGSICQNLELLCTNNSNLKYYSLPEDVWFYWYGASGHCRYVTWPRSLSVEFGHRWTETTNLISVAEVYSWKTTFLVSVERCDIVKLNLISPFEWPELSRWGWRCWKRLKTFILTLTKASHAQVLLPTVLKAC